MANETPRHFRWFLENGVAVVEVISRELNQPKLAQEFGAELRALLVNKASDRILLDFRKTTYMSSTAFAALLDFSKAASAAGVRLGISGMDPNVRFGADILSLDRFIPIFDDDAAALASLGQSGPG